MKRYKKLTAALLGAIMALSVTGFTAFAEENNQAETTGNNVLEAENGVIKLTEDTSISTITVNSDITYDLNGYDLTYTGGPITFEEHTLKFIDSSVSGSKRGGTLILSGVTGTTSAINPNKNATAEARNIKIECTGSVFYPQGNAASVNIIDCDVEAAIYCVGTNAATVDNYGVIINIENSNLTSSSDDGDNTAVLINVGGTLI